MNEFKKWHSKAYHPDYGHEHLEWEELAWNAAIDAAIDKTIEQYDWWTEDEAGRYREMMLVLKV